jgi:hypothetical protein
VTGNRPAGWARPRSVRCRLENAAHACPCASLTVNHATTTLLLVCGDHRSVDRTLEDFEVVIVNDGARRPRAVLES